MSSSACRLSVRPQSSDGVEFVFNLAGFAASIRSYFCCATIALPSNINVRMTFRIVYSLEALK